jgi:hypothetical protein
MAVPHGWNDAVDESTRQLLTTKSIDNPSGWIIINAARRQVKS